jgi:hypothetical protein
MAHGLTQGGDPVLDQEVREALDVSVRDVPSDRLEERLGILVSMQYGRRSHSEGLLVDEECEVRSEVVDRSTVTPPATRRQVVLVQLLGLLQHSAKRTHVSFVVRLVGRCEEMVGHLPSG